MDLIDAIIKNDQQEVAELLLKGCDPQQAEDAANVTPLHFAVQYHHLEVALLLLNAGADPLAQEGDGGDTPLDLAIQLKNDRMIKLLTWFAKHQEGDPPLLS